MQGCLLACLFLDQWDACAGLPAVAVPCGFDHSCSDRALPVGLQVIGSAFDEQTIIQVAHTFEQTADFAFAIPNLK